MACHVQHCACSTKYQTQVFKLQSIFQSLFAGSNQSTKTVSYAGGSNKLPAFFGMILQHISCFILLLSPSSYFAQEIKYDDNKLKT